MEEFRITLSSRKLPNEYSCEGEDRSPPIEVGGLNTAITKSLAILVDDPDAPGGGGFVHWTAWNVEPVKVIPEAVPKTPEVRIPLRAVQGRNSFGKIGYSGPCPPRGQTHRYFFKVYGLDTLLDLPGGSTKDQLVRAMEDHIVQYGETNATFGR
jgi:Raf kinase inhibitor-like YbhB/YbcL family protein